MELTAIFLACNIISLLCAFMALGFSIWNFIEMMAQKRTTHTIMPVPTGPDMGGDSLEKYMEKITKAAGADQKDLNRNLFNMGMDLEEDDLV